MTIPPALREALSTLGHSLPTLWHQDTLSRAQRKALLRCLLDKVVLERRTPDTITTRIVWRGGAVSELEVPCTVGTLRDLTGFAQMEAQVLRLEAQGHADEDIAQRLTAQGFRSPQRPRVLASTIRTIRLRHGRLHRYRGPRPRRVPSALTVPQIATAVGVKPHWVYHLIPYSQNIRTRVPTGVYAPTIARTSACLPYHAHRYSLSIWTVQAAGERQWTGNTCWRLSRGPLIRSCWSAMNTW